MCYTVLYYTMLYYTILYYTILYYSILCYAMLCYTMVCSAVIYSSIYCNGGDFVMVEMRHNPLQEDGCLTPSHYMILYHTQLGYTILFPSCPVLYYTILYYTTLYYTIVCSAVIYSSIYCNGGDFVMVEMRHNPLQEDGCLTPSHCSYNIMY